MGFLDTGSLKGGGLSNTTFSDTAGGVSDIFSSFGHDAKARGDIAESLNYQLAAGYANENEKYTELSTGIKELQLNRSIYQAIGGQQADVAGAGFAASGSALDLMADSANQGALAKSVLAQQGIITEAGYREQAQSYTNMSNAAIQAADAEKKAGVFSTITGGLKIAAGLASIITGLPFGAAADGFVPQAPSDPNNPLVINRYGQPGPVSTNPANPLGAIY